MGQEGESARPGIGGVCCIVMHCGSGGEGISPVGGCPLEGPQLAAAKLVSLRDCRLVVVWKEGVCRNGQELGGGALGQERHGTRLEEANFLLPAPGDPGGDAGIWGSSLSLWALAPA